MRPVLLVLLAFLVGTVAADPPEPEPEPDPVLIERSLPDVVPGPVLVPAAWAAAVVGAGTAVSLASWAAASAPSPGSFTALAWATGALALAAAALDYLFTIPPDPPPS